MRKALLFFFICILAIAGKVNAQNDSLFRLLKKIEYPVTFYAVDNVGGLYLVNLDNQLKKYSEIGDSVGVFNQVTKYGKLTFIEARNPWKTLLFYKDFATIVMLDKYLNVTGSINLRNKNIFKVNALTSSYDNNIWLFDEQDNKIKKIDDAGSILMESTDLRRVLNEAISPKRIIDDDGLLYLYDPDNGLYIFDYYGTFKKKLNALHWDDFAVINKKIYGFDKQHIFEEALTTNTFDTLTFPGRVGDAGQIRLVNHKVYMLRDGYLYIYNMQ